MDTKSKNKTRQPRRRGNKNDFIHREKRWGELQNLHRRATETEFRKPRGLGIRSSERFTARIDAPRLRHERERVRLARWLDWNGWLRGRSDGGWCWGWRRWGVREAELVVVLRKAVHVEGHVLGGVGDLAVEERSDVADLTGRRRARRRVTDLLPLGRVRRARHWEEREAWHGRLAPLVGRRGLGDRRELVDLGRGASRLVLGGSGGHEGGEGGDGEAELHGSFCKEFDSNGEREADWGMKAAVALVCGRSID